MIRIVHKKFGYIIEIAYNKECKKEKNNNNWCSIDIGLNNLCSITSNRVKPILINGRILKSINQWYNKQLSLLKSGKKKNELIKKHYFRIQNYFHHVSKFIINYCLKNNITNIIIGHNKNWKQGINHGKVNNQNFVFIPFNELIQKISYKAELNGIQTLVVEESYTSKASYFDNDLMQKDFEFSGKRIKRGLYRTKGGFLINADVNGSLNISRKVIDNMVEMPLVNRSLVARPLKINPLHKLEYFS
jgi:IS605 OrfB family transposase